MKLTQVLPSVYQLVKFLFFIFSHRTKQDKGQRVFQNKNEIKTKNLKGFKPSLFRESKKRKKGMRKIKFLCSVLSSSQDMLEGKRFFQKPIPIFLRHHAIVFYSIFPFKYLHVLQYRQKIPSQKIQEIVSVLRFYISERKSDLCIFKLINIFLRAN